MRELAARNVDAEGEICFLGAGMYDHYSPAIVDTIMSRSEFLTPYTPYQPEISQGGLQVMFEFQTAMSELTGLPLSSAGLYEGPSTVAAAAYLAIGATKRRKLIVSAGLHPDSRATVRTYADGFPAEVVEVPLSGGVTDPDALAAAIDDETAAVFVQYPSFVGGVEDLEKLAGIAHDAGALIVAACDPIALGILKPPGRVRRRHRRRRGPAARQPFGLRRPFVWILLRHRGADAPHAGPDRRGDRRRRRPPRASSSRCRPASSTSAARRRPTTSARRRR